MHEWGTLRVAGVSPTDRDKALSEELGAGDRKLVIDWLIDGARIRSSSWVGVARFSTFEVQVVPKLTGGNLGVMTMVGYASGIEALSILATPRDYNAASGGLADLWCLVLAREAENILLGGPLFDYAWQESSQPALRGRLMMIEQLSRHFGQVDSLECRFEDYSSDVLDNQIVLSGLRAGRAIASDPDIAQRMTRLAAAFSEYCGPLGLEPDTAEQQIQYNRRNEHYKAAHMLALLLLRNLQLRDIYSTGHKPAVAFLLDMNPLFEQFATRLVISALVKEPVYVVPQQRSSSIIINEATGRTYSRVIPDMLLKVAGARRQLPVDAKYKLYDNRTIDPADIYQVFMYAYAFQSEEVPTPAAMIVYPAETTSTVGVRLRVQNVSATQSARLVSYPLPVALTLARIRDHSIQASPELADLRQALLHSFSTS
jgi:5-methylcytosine-specific restriction enzyme subunit McrC